MASNEAVMEQGAPHSDAELLLESDHAPRRGLQGFVKRMALPVIALLGVVALASSAKYYYSSSVNRHGITSPVSQALEEEVTGLAASVHCGSITCGAGGTCCRGRFGDVCGAPGATCCQGSYGVIVGSAGSTCCKNAQGAAYLCAPGNLCHAGACIAPR